MEHEPKRGDVRESDGMICWGYTWKDAQGNKRYQWLTPERFAEKMADDKKRLAKYVVENAETIRVKQAEKYQLKYRSITLSGVSSDLFLKFCPGWDQTWDLIGFGLFSLSITSPFTIRLLLPPPFSSELLCHEFGAVLLSTRRQLLIG